LLRVGNRGGLFGSPPISNRSALDYNRRIEARPNMDAYRRVYQALDLALATSERAVAPGTEAAVQAAIAELRAQNGPPEAVATLQEISVDLVRLNRALHAGDRQECQIRRARLEAVKNQWMLSAPLH
jgi:hypothetical protein